MIEANISWKNILAEIEVEVGSHLYKMHLKNSRLISFENNLAVVEVSNIASQQTITTRFLNKIIAAIERQNNLQGVSVEIITSKEPISTKVEQTLFDTDKPIIKRELKTTYEEPSFDYQKAHLSTKYTFNTFVVGSTNNFAHAAALGVVKNPGKEYNPFFLYGGVGVGKTHLMQAIGNELYRQNSKLKILYVSAETFMNEYIESLQKKTTDQFRKKYRYLDLLMIDDIQSISGKEATQDEIFNTFNSLHQAEKQIILTSDRRPEEIEKVESRIISRFMGGLTVDIQIPDFETRVAIITEKLTIKNQQWGREVVEYVAALTESNIRELEGTINKILSASLLHPGEITIESVKKILGDTKKEVSQTKKITISPKNIISHIAKHYGVKTNDLMSDSRSAIFVKPRQMAMYILRVECGINYQAVADLLNRKDHTTVIHAVEKLQLAYKTDPGLREQLVVLKKDLWG